MSKKPLGKAMRILIVPSTFDCLNMGDVAMLQVAIARLTKLWPAASIQVLTQRPSTLVDYCPGVQPLPDIGCRAWFVDRDLFGRL